MEKGLTVAVINDSQPFQGQHRFDDVDSVRCRSDDDSQAAGSDDFGLTAQFLAHAGHDAVYLADEAIEDTGLHTFDGVAANDLIRADDFDTRQFRRALYQGICRDADARADSTAEVGPFLVDGAEGRRRAEVDDDDRAAEFSYAATALTMRSAPTSRGLSYLMSMPVLTPGPMTSGVRPK